MISYWYNYTPRASCKGSLNVQLVIYSNKTKPIQCFSHCISRRINLLQDYNLLQDHQKQIYLVFVMLCQTKQSSQKIFEQNKTHTRVLHFIRRRINLLQDYNYVLLQHHQKNIYLVFNHFIIQISGLYWNRNFSC